MDMIKRYAVIYLILGLFVGVAACNRQKTCKVKFEVIAPNLAEADTVFISGNGSELGNWNPAAIAMNKVSNQRFVKEIALPPHSEIEFKFTLGSWASEALSDQEQGRENEYAKIESDTLIRLTVLHWKDGEDSEIRGQVSGEVNLHKGFRIQGIPDRDISVWLPPKYHESAESYPVLYMQDGQNCFDPKTSSFGIDWQIDETCTKLIEQNLLEKIIVVAVNNTANRSVEYVPGEDARLYMKLLTQKIKPFVDSNYRTLADREHTAVGGSSAGGTISFMLLWEYPELFSKAICMSPALKIEDIDYVKVVQQRKKPKQPIYIYMDNGGVGLENRLQPGIDGMIKALEEKGYRRNIDFYWKKDSLAQHNESAWAKRFPVAIRLLFGKKIGQKN